MDIGWDKRLTKELIDKGLSWEQARVVVGIIAEQRQIADREGYTRGYNDGCAEMKRGKYDLSKTSGNSTIHSR